MAEHDLISIGCRGAVARLTLGRTFVVVDAWCCACVCYQLASPDDFHLVGFDLVVRAVLFNQGAPCRIILSLF